MKEEIKIIPATPEDAEGIVNVLYKTWLATYPNKELGITTKDIEESFKDSFTEESLNKLKSRISDVSENDKRLVAKKNGEIIATARVTKNENNNRLETIYVIPEFQNRGVGTMLWEEIKKFCDLTKDTVVQTAAYNQNSIEFYKKLGFVDTGKRFSEASRRTKKIGVSIPQLEMKIKASKK